MMFKNVLYWRIQVSFGYVEVDGNRTLREILCDCLQFKRKFGEINITFDTYCMVQVRFTLAEIKNRFLFC